VAAWKGWEDEFLTAAQVQITAANVRFLDEWHSHAETNCTRNPIDLSASVSGSTNCHSLPGVTARAQNYTTHGNAARAFFDETHRASSTALIAALKSGDPYTVSNTGNVAQDLTAWGSQKFAQFYFNETAGQRGGSGGGDNYAPHAMKAWGEIQKTVNKKMPQTLRRMSGFHHATQTQLRRKHRVRH
jgi:hypothetical protein